MTSFSYSLLPPGPDTDEGSSDILIDAYSVRLIGSTFDTIENFETEDQYFLGVTSSISGAFTVLGLFLEDTDIVGNDETDFLFVLDGSIPSITTVAEWEAFENSLTSVDVASSPFGSGQDIPLTSLGATVTEDDLINGTEGVTIWMAASAMTRSMAVTTRCWAAMARILFMALPIITAS